MCKRSLFYVFLVLFLSFGAVSCTEHEETPVPEFSLVEDSVSAEAQGGTYSLEYKLLNPLEDVSVTFSGQPEWITELADMGSSIKIVVSANPDQSERSCVFDVIYDTVHEKITVTQAAALPVKPTVKFTISAVTSAENEAQVTVSLDLQGGDESLVSEYGFVYGEGENVKEEGEKVIFPYSEKGPSFTETVSGLVPDNVRYSFYPYLKFSDGEELYGELYEYVHYWEEITRLVDIDGNEYPVFLSGGRYWMGADLRVTKYNDGTAITNITDNAQWVAAEEGAYCYYDNNQENAAVYGALYNFAAAGSDRICPQGWSLPTSQEWKDLAVSQGGKENHDEYGDYFSALGVKFKTADYWTDKKPGKNTFGFNGVPGGCRRFNDGLFNVMGEVAYYWSADVADENNVIIYYLRLYNFANTKLDKKGGFSVRCVRDTVSEPAQESR